MTIAFFGVLAACFALILELVVAVVALADTPAADPHLLFSGTELTLAVVLSLLGIALIEECAKYLFLRQYALRFFPTVASTIRGSFVLALLFGLGFASLELGLIVSGLGSAPALGLIGMTGLHIGTSFIFAFYLFSYSDERPLFPGSLLWSAILCHMLYNIGIFFLT